MNLSNIIIFLMLYLYMAHPTIFNIPEYKKSERLLTKATDYKTVMFIEATPGDSSLKMLRSTEEKNMIVEPKNKLCFKVRCKTCEKNSTEKSI